MKAGARIVAEADPAGTTRLTTLAGQAPLLLRRTGPRGPTATVQLVGGAAGPIGGDQLALSVEVGAGAAVRVESVAASVALPGTGGGQSRLDIRARIDAGGSLVWSPQPLIAARGARHRTDSRIDLGAGARLSWREEIVLGRSDEEPGSIAAPAARAPGRTSAHRSRPRPGPGPSRIPGARGDRRDSAPSAPS